MGAPKLGAPKMGAPKLEASGKMGASGGGGVILFTTVVGSSEWSHLKDLVKLLHIVTLEFQSDPLPLKYLGPPPPFKEL